MDTDVAGGPSERDERGRGYLLAIGLALAGGAFGIFGAFVQELQAGPLVAFIGAPIIEESLKPAGVYLLLARWPHLLRNQLHTASLSALGGVAFSLIETIIYLYAYFPEHRGSLAIYRLSLALPLHTIASFIFGLGINQRLLASVKGEIPFLSVGKRFFFTAMALHAAYNIAVTIAQIGPELGR
ncbi:MAG: PrsW family intramembrane metalloprotease [Chloroflexi bacterium]|nr:PrsW family intramembrane metalloprotease [Chloroflexota bacterium]